MKRMALLLLAVAALGFVAEGCHAQVPPTSYEVSLTWTAPGGVCLTGDPCTYILSRAVLTAGVTACPITTGTQYTPLNQSAPATGTSYADTTAAGLTVCYLAQTEQDGNISAPSNIVGPFAVPASPGAPTLTGAQKVAAADLTPCPTCSLTIEPTPAAATGLVGRPTLVARLEPVR